MNFAAMAAGFLAGFIGSLGLGGGGVLVLFLTLFLGFAQLRAQGVNLLFFIPIGVFALVWHTRRGLVRWRLALSAAGTGILGAVAGALLALRLGSGVTGKIFGALLLVLGFWELFRPAAKKNPPLAAGRPPVDSAGEKR